MEVRQRQRRCLGLRSRRREGDRTRASSERADGCVLHWIRLPQETLVRAELARQCPEVAHYLLPLPQPLSRHHSEGWQGQEGPNFWLASVLSKKDTWMMLKSLWKKDTWLNALSTTGSGSTWSCVSSRMGSENTWWNAWSKMDT